jgi:hypothetical protein
MGSAPGRSPCRQESLFFPKPILHPLNRFNRSTRPDATPATTASRAWKRCRPLWFRINTPVRIAWIVASVLLAPLRRRFRFDPARLQAFILVRDLHSPLQGLVSAFAAQGIPLGRITLVDTGCTAPECLAELRRLQELGCPWHRLPPAHQAFGPYSPWLSPVLRHQLQASRYPVLVTDADLAFPAAMPADWLERLFTALNRHRFALKVALPLSTVQLTVAQHEQIVAHEQGLMRHPAYRLLTTLLLRRDPGSAACTTDTTLALYRPAGQFSTLSVRLPHRYAVRHLPWYREFVDTEEFRYYTTHKLALFGEWSSLRVHG